MFDSLPIETFNLDFMSMLLGLVASILMRNSLKLYIIMDWALEKQKCDKKKKLERN